MKIKEIMSRNVISVRPDDLASEALNSLFRLKISGLPVIDENGKLVGMFTEKEILVKILPSYLEKVGKFIYEENPVAIKKKIVELSRIKVSQLMRTEVFTVTENTGLCESAKNMLTQKARRLPVLDETGKVVGILAREDVLRALIKEAGII